LVIWPFPIRIKTIYLLQYHQNGVKVLQHRNGTSNRKKWCDPDMKNIYEVLRQKELEVQQLQKDIEALRVAARLLADDEAEASSSRPLTSSATTPRISAAAAVAAAVKPAEPMSQSVGIRQFP
jgi:hypothetical protein